MHSPHYAAVRAVVDQVACPPFEFAVHQDECGVYVAAKLYRPDTDTGQMGWGLGAWYPIPVFDEGREDQQRDFVVKRCLVAALSFAEHEVREAFVWKDRRVFGPHMPLDRLWEIARG